MERKNKFFLVIGIILFYLSLMVYFYYDYSNSLESYNLAIYQEYDTLQDLIHKIHMEDSNLYKILLSDNINSFNTTLNLCSTDNHSSEIIGDILKLKENNAFSSEKIIFAIDDYYTLEQIRTQILQLNTAKVINKTYDNEISNLITKYDIQMNLILTNINNEIKSNKEKNLTFINELKNDFILKEIMLFLIFIVSIFLLLYSDKTEDSLFLLKKSKIDSNLDIMDSDMNKIMLYIKDEIKNGYFPTIKDVKLHVNLSHPTILIKLNELEKRKLISIKKKGRNKHIFLL